MAKFNFDLERGARRSRRNGGNVVRIVLLFCLVAAVTAAGIYFILPKSAPEKTPSDGTENVVKNDSGTEEQTADVPAAGDSAVKGDENKTPENSQDDKGNSAEENSNENSNENSDATEQNGDTAQSGESGDNGGTSSAASGGTAKYDPAASELLKVTESFRNSLQNGSWKKGKDVGVHSVKAGDFLERIARRNSTTVEFLKRANGIVNANSIRIGQKIFFLKAEKWQITISRKKGELLLERVLNGHAVPFALFPCRLKAGVPEENLMIVRRFSEPVYIDADGRKFPAGTEGNPYGGGLLALNRSRICIHGQGDAPAVEKSVKSGGIVLHNQDIELLYLLVPEKTSVKIVE